MGTRHMMASRRAKKNRNLIPHLLLLSLPTATATIDGHGDSSRQSQKKTNFGARLRRATGGRAWRPERGYTFLRVSLIF